MKKMILFLMILVSVPTYAQRVDKPGESYEVYCSLRMITGQQCKITLPDNKEMYIVDENDNPLIFNSIISALSYMAKRGWEFCFVYEGCYYTIKKKITSDEEITKYIHISDNPKKKEKAK